MNQEQITHARYLLDLLDLGLTSHRWHGKNVIFNERPVEYVGTPRQLFDELRAYILFALDDSQTQVNVEKVRQSTNDSYPPIGVVVLNQDNEPVFWGGVNWWSAKLHEWRIVTVTSWRDVVQSEQSTAVEVDA